MPASSRISLPLRSVVGSLLLFSGLLLLNACGTSESARTQETASRTLHLTAIDSSSKAPLDSARALNRTFGDSLRTDSAGHFTIRDVEPALHVFDVSGYGYHSQRHLGILVEPDDDTVSRRTELLPKRLTMNCEDHRPYFWEGFKEEYNEDPSRTRLKLIEAYAENGEVEIQPIAVNNLATPVFLPDNFGTLGHYEVQLYDGNNNRIPFTYENAPPDEGHRIYSKEDIIPVVPQGTERLTSSTLLVSDTIDEGTTLYARMQYTFSSDDTLSTTSATTFPDLKLDSLQVPIFDTLRTAGEVTVPDSLVLQRDTSIVEVVGIDTIVTRKGYTLFSTLRESNAAPTPEAARNLLYVPDSVKARARRDSLEAVTEADTTGLEVDTAATTPPDERTPLQVVDRTNRSALQALVDNNRLIELLSRGLPSPGMSADSLLSLSTTLQNAYLQTPDLSTTRVRRGINLIPDSARVDSVILSAPASDSLFQLFAPDTLADADTSISQRQANPFLFAEPGVDLAPDIDSISIDSLPLTVFPDADSVATGSVVTSYLGTPPSYTYWYLPASYSQTGGPLLIVDPTFFQLRAEPRIDMTAGTNPQRLLPDRIGRREQLAYIRYPQQVIRSPLGTYRREYLKVWKTLQRNNLREHYCEIFPFSIQSDWRSMSMH